MRQIIKRFYISAFVIAVLSSFAFRSSSAITKRSIFLGYRKVAAQCEATDVECTTNGGLACTNANSDVLYKLVGSSCPNQLWRIP
jgi:hypothetical protein